MAVQNKCKKCGQLKTCSRIVKNFLCKSCGGKDNVELVATKATA